MASIVEEFVFENKTLPPGFEVLLEQKAADLFAICDQENKGFVTKRDMQRLKNELPLGPDQLENVFDLLDEDASGYLTLDEFTRGFEGYLGIEPNCIENNKERNLELEDNCDQKICYEECYGKIIFCHVKQISLVWSMFGP